MGFTHNGRFDPNLPEDHSNTLYRDTTKDREAFIRDECDDQEFWSEDFYIPADEGFEHFVGFPDSVYYHDMEDFCESIGKEKVQWYATGNGDRAEWADCADEATAVAMKLKFG